MLRKNLSKVNAFINELYLSNQLDENQANTYYTLAYLYSHLEFIKTRTTYLPLNEFQLLQTTISSLLPDSNDNNDIDNNFNSNVLPELVSHLIYISDILIQRHAQKDPQKQLDILSAVDKTLQKLPDNLFKLAKVITPSITADYLAKQSSKSLQEESKNPTSEKAAELFRQCEQIKAISRLEYYTNTLIQMGKKIFRKKSPYFESESEEKSAHEKELSDFLCQVVKSLGDKLISEDEFIKLIKLVKTKYPDKTQFVISCLKAYHNAYCHFGEKTRGIDLMLAHVSTLFDVLIDESLQPGELKEIIAKIDFRLTDPQACENDMAYRHGYEASMKVLDGKEIPDVEGSFRLDYNSKILPRLLKIIGKNSLAEIKLPSSSLPSTPPLLQIKIMDDFSPDLLNKFEKFLQLLIRINEKANPQHQRNIFLLFVQYSDSMIQLIRIMGITAIKYLRKQVSHSLLPLERLLKLLPALDNELIDSLTTYFNKQKQMTDKDIDTFKTCLTILGVLTKNENLNLHGYDIYQEDETREKFCMKIAEGKSPKDFLYALTTLLLKSLLIKEENIELTEQQINQMLERMPPEDFTNLAAAAKHMHNNSYQKVFLNLLKLDLTAGDINSFLHDTEQKDYTANSLARHNQAIRQELTAHGVSPEIALEYKEKYEFVVLPNGENDLDLDNQYSVLWNYILQLQEKTKIEQKSILEKAEAETKTSEPNKTPQRINAILTRISELENLIHKKDAKSSQEITDVLSKKHVQGLLNIIKKNCIEIEESEYKPVNNGFYEFSNHFKSQLALIQNNISSTTSKKKSIKPGYFRIEQWSKDNPRTFLLGDEVGCCLATTGAQFQAMVQRRMDDAMLFHVATDVTTGRPAALIWLYLAKTSKGEIVLMANFFEVHTKFGNDNHLRKAILNGLLEFTQQYLQKNPKIDGFYMNQLTYGWNKQDLLNYPVKPLDIVNKVGGFYNPYSSNTSSDSKEDAATRSQTKAQYYLVSLDKHEFHEFSSSTLYNETNPNIVPVQKLIQETVLKLSETETSINTVIDKLIKKHSLELQPFFKNPLKTDETFRQKVTDAFNSAMAARPARDETTPLASSSQFTLFAGQSPTIQLSSSSAAQLQPLTIQPSSSSTAQLLR